MRVIYAAGLPGRVVATLIVSSWLMAGCAAAGGDPSAARDDEDRLHVVTTVSPITNIVANVGGSAVSVTGIVPEGANSHTFEPAPSDAALMEQADIVFMNGLHLEEPTRELAEANIADEVPVVQLGELTIGPDEYIFDFSFPEAEGDPNPHLWTNPPYVKRYAEIVGSELSSLDPINAAMYRRNVEAFAARIDELDALVREVTETVPPENRKLLTYHDSFPYFAREYGWQVIGAVQPSDFSDPTPQEVAGLIDQIEAEQIPTIFGSEVFPSPVLEQIAAETGAEYVDDLRDDDLPGEAGDPDHSYFGLMVYDYVTFMSALGGDTAPFAALDVSDLHEDNAEYRD
ncbi:MAG: metal ABC transporter substrate-binding protein [Actinomycetota bacterium]